jgi:hypothetical protein
MTSADRQILFTALGFLAVILRNDVPHEKQALRAMAIADLIEAFCRSALPEQFKEENLKEAACS